MRDTQHRAVHKQNGQKGFTLFFAIIVVGIVAIVAAFVATSAYRDLDLAATGTASQYAFYAADSGVECMVYHYQNREKEFASNQGNFQGGGSNRLNYYQSGHEFSCGDDVVQVSVGEGTGGGFTTKFTSMEMSGGSCADIEVWRETGSATTTIIRSRGYADCEKEEFERGVQVMFTEEEE